MHMKGGAGCSAAQRYNSCPLSPGPASWYNMWSLTASNLEPLHTINAWRFSRASEGPARVEAPRRACQAHPATQLVQRVEPYHRNLEPLPTINAGRFSRASAGPCHGRISTRRLSGRVAEAPVENDESWRVEPQNIRNPTSNVGGLYRPWPESQSAGLFKDVVLPPCRVSAACCYSVALRILRPRQAPAGLIAPGPGGPTRNTNNVLARAWTTGRPQPEGLLQPRV